MPAAATILIMLTTIGIISLWDQPLPLFQKTTMSSLVWNDTNIQVLNISNNNNHENHQKKKQGTGHHHNDEKHVHLAQSPPTTTTTTNATAANYLYYETNIPLQPPFFIYQFGSPRSGSTFQYQLLLTLAHWKSPTTTGVFAKHGPSYVQAIPHDLARNYSFDMKKHDLHTLENILTKKTTSSTTTTTNSNNKIALFSSGTLTHPSVLHHQSKESLVNCSLCEIDHYRPIFGLNNTELTMLKNHFRLYQPIRQCCGLQSSKYHRFTLHGCNDPYILQRRDNPHCEQYNMTNVELEFAASPLPYVPIDPHWNWAQPGDCQKWDLQMIHQGKDFNGRGFVDCATFIKTWM